MHSVPKIRSTQDCISGDQTEQRMPDIGALIIKPPLIGQIVAEQRDLEFRFTPTGALVIFGDESLIYVR